MNKDGKAKDLGFGHLGNGITVWDRSHACQFSGYLIVAHIDAYRKISYRENAPLSEEQIKAIENCAATDDSSISSTQETKVFRIPPQAPDIT